MSAGEIIRTATRAWVTDKPLTIREAAVEARVSRRTMGHWLRQGLSHSKLSKNVLITRQDLFGWIAVHRTSALSYIAPPKVVGRKRRKS